MIQLIHCIGLLLLFAFPAAAQDSRMEGSWEGKLPVGNGITMVLHLSHDPSAGWKALMDSPDQGARGIPCGKPVIEGDSLLVPVPAVNGSYRAHLDNDSTLNGLWTQGRSFPLLLHKTVHPTELQRPQTPKPPFPYFADSVTYTGAHTGIRYGATITRPTGKGPFPAIILITGSGAQNRDEEIFGHKPFAVIADYLTRRGFMVLRADDRGVGLTNGSFAQSTTADFAGDAEAHLDYLLTLPETDKHRIGLLGHSEGGIIAPMVAARRPGNVSFIILLAGPAQPVAQLMAEQNLAILKKAGIKDEAAEQYAKFYEKAVPAIAMAPDPDSALRQFRTDFEKWRAGQPSNRVLATTGVFDDSTAMRYTKAMVAQIYSPWFRYFIQIDPQPDLRKLQCPVLALNGGEDIQVPPTENLAAMRDCLKSDKSEHVEIKELPGLNHLFQECHLCTVSEYAALTQTIAPAALDAMGKWLGQLVPAGK